MTSRTRHLLYVAAMMYLLAFLFFAWESHPYRGGLNRFEKIFRVDFPDDIKMERLKIFEGSFSDNPRFRFVINPEQHKAISKILQTSGYSEWEEGGGGFGSFFEESRSDDPLFCSYKAVGRWRLMFFYRPSTGRLDAVSFFN